MKKCFLLLLFICNLSFGQNWAPIVSSNEYCYFSSQLLSSASVIKTDSLIAQGTDTTFFLNLVIKPTYPVSYTKLKNQGQFLQKKVVSRSNGFVTFKGDSSFTLKTNATLGETWVFDSLLNLNASVIQVKQDSVLGQLDSLKVISTSNSDTIIISKNYGIIYFKNIASNQSFMLKGISNLNLGYQLPNQRNIYDFNVGDVFEYRLITGLHAQSIYNSYKNFYHSIITILTKASYNDSIIYTIQKKSYDTIQNGYITPWNPPTITSQTITTTLKYSFNASDFLNRWNHALIPGSTCAYGNQPYRKEHLFNFNSVFNTPVKLYDYDPLYTIHGDSLDKGNCPNTFSACFGRGFGEVYSHSWDDQSWMWPGSGTKTHYTDKYLIGSIKNGIQYGYISPFTVTPQVGLEELNTGNTFNVYPTVFSNYINIKDLNEDYDVSISDIMGRIIFSKHVLSGKDSPNQMDLSFLETGNYVLKIIDNQNRLSTKKIIKISQ